MIDRYNIRKKATILRSGGCGCKRHATGTENARKLADKKDLTGKTIGDIKILELTGEKKVLTGFINANVCAVEKSLKLQVSI